MSNYDILKDTAFLVFNSCLLCMAWILNWAGINPDAFFVLSVLVVFDYITGIGKAKKLKIPITSKTSTYGILAKLSILIMPLILGLTAKGLDVDASTFVNVAMDLIILSELYSIIGNVYTIRSGEKIAEYDALSLLANKIKQTMLKLADSKDDKES